MPRDFRGSVGIVPALDVDTPQQLNRVVMQTSEVHGVVGYKLGLTSVLRFGLAEAVRRLRDMTDLPLLYDHQKAGPDMPDMARRFVMLCKEAAVDGLILFPVAGPTAVDRFVGESLKAAIIPIVGGEIPVPDYCVSGGGYIIDDALARILECAAQNKATHFVLPAHNNAKVKGWSRWIAANVKDATVFLTGFGPLGGSVKTAFAAAAEIPRRFAIVGRLITSSNVPGDAAKRLVAELESKPGRRLKK